MIGIVIVTHRQLGKALIEAAESVLGDPPDAVISVSVNPGADTDMLRKKIGKGIRAVNRKKGVLIFTDMFDGTPANLSYSFLREGAVDIISSVNLPILLKAITSRKKMSFASLTQCLEAYGRRNISLASGVLKGQSRSSASFCPFEVTLGQQRDMAVENCLN